MKILDSLLEGMLRHLNIICVFAKYSLLPAM